MYVSGKRDLNCAVFREFMSTDSKTGRKKSETCWTVQVT